MSPEDQIRRAGGPFSGEQLYILTILSKTSMWLHVASSMVVVSSFLLLWSCLTQNAIGDAQMTSLHNTSLSDISFQFELKQIHDKIPGGRHLRLDVAHESDFSTATELDESGLITSCEIKGQSSQIKRIKDRSPDSMESYIFHSLQHPEINMYDSLEWSIDDIVVPNISDSETILQLAKLASNAYARLPADPSWRDVSDPASNFGKAFNDSDGFGWTESGLRGHIFVESIDEEKFNRSPLIIIAIKGTSAAGLGGGNGGDDGEGGRTGDDGRTVEMDKFNDNLLFSCCCARVSSLWTTVCDCYEKAYTCNQNCLERSLRNPDRYYKAVLDIYRNVREQYPDNEVWVTGHSLGGALSSLLGRTYGLPAVTFEAPGELLATKRLHLPMPPGLPVEMEHIWHFGNNADPIFMGVCNGASSSCGIAGYAMESVCHSGLKCVYDTVTNLGWHVNILNHRLKTVIDKLLMMSNETAQCVKPPPCLDCYDWTFVDHSNNRKRVTKSISHPSPTSSSSSTTSGTKKRKCLKRTWYGSCYKWSDDDDDDGSGMFFHKLPVKTDFVI